MTCRCGYEFCWSCEEPYLLGMCHHNSTCRNFFSFYQDDDGYFYDIDYENPDSLEIFIPSHQNSWAEEFDETNQDDIEKTQVQTMEKIWKSITDNIEAEDIFESLWEIQEKENDLFESIWNQDDEN